MYRGRHGEFVAVCGARKCGRSWVSTVHWSELSDWLMACHALTLKEITRCPRHITQWSCRTAGVPWTVDVRTWANQAQEKDMKRYPVLAPSWQDPVPLPDGLVVGRFIKTHVGGF